jgi:hypothetical protein
MDNPEYTETDESPAVPDRRSHVRREMDVQRIATLLTIGALLVAWGIAWATATAAVAQKVDRAEFARYVAEAERRFQLDSLERAYQATAWRRIEIKLDSTNERLSRLICEKGPTYCR